jgi:hypothetical protein
LEIEKNKTIEELEKRLCETTDKPHQDASSDVTENPDDNEL